MSKTSEKSRSSGACHFCSILGGATRDQFDSVWLTNREFSAVVSIGALVPGWSLIAPAAHVCNLSNSYADGGFLEFTRAALEVVQARYGKCAVFEHGPSAGDSLTGCGVGHAHLHLVPVDFSLEREALRFAPELAWKRCKATDLAAVVGGREYLFAADTFDGRDCEGLIAILRQPKSQFFRRVIASRLGAADLFDYKKFPMLDVARASADELRVQAAHGAGV